MRKSWKLRVVPLVVLALVATACAEEEAAPGEIPLITAGFLTVCTDAPFPPMEFEQDGVFTGFDMELIRAIANEMGLGVTILNSGFDPITSGAVFEAGDCDIAAASITILDSREANVDFSAAYFNADQSLLVKTETGITSLEETGGTAIAVQEGTTGQAYAQRNAPADATLVSFVNPGDLFVALEAGDVQSVLQDFPVNQDRANNDATTAIVETYPTNEFYGFAAKNEGSELLLAAVNEALSKLRRDGVYDQIFADWFG